MLLNEAIKKLNKAGFICEDTETQDDEHSDLVRNSGVGDFKSIKKIVNLEKKHLDLEDKIAAAKNYNAEHPAWERMSDKEKAAAILKLLDDGHKFMDENPLNPDSSDIFADFYDIPELAEIWDQATEKLEDIYLSDDEHWSSEWDDWLFSYGDDILVDILKGKNAKQIVKEYRSELD